MTATSAQENYRVADCLFCRIVAGKLPASIVYSNERVMGFNDIAPQAPTHVLFVDQEHTPGHRETEDPQLFARLMSAARDYARQQELSNYRLVINNGAGAGQSVFHLHLHLLAGRPLSWPPG